MYNRPITTKSIAARLMTDGKTRQDSQQAKQTAHMAMGREDLPGPTGENHRL